MRAHYDVVIVGARCAGATLATYLARAGASVLLLDRSALPSELVLSTHTVHPSGMRVVDELGLGQAVRSVSPEMRTMRLDWHGGVLDLAFEPGAGEYCPRRKRFDGLLQSAATAAGAELRDRCEVSGLIEERGRVRGVTIERKGGRELIGADLVVGADGRNSRVARWVGAESYLGYEAPRGMYWGYFPAPPGWGACAQYPSGMYVRRIGQSVRVAFHTDGDQLLLGALPLKAELGGFRRDPLGALRGALQGDAMLASIVAREPCEPVRGFAGDHYFLRRAAGPGWLLLGDAGLHKDFLSGDGMSEAMLQARSAAAAVVAAQGARDTAAQLERWWRQRDVEGLPLFFHARELADPDESGELDRLVFAHVARDPALKARFASIFTRALAPHEALPPLRVLRWCASAALRGRPRLIGEFLRRGARTREVTREIGARRRLATAAAEGAPLPWPRADPTLA